MLAESALQALRSTSVENGVSAQFFCEDLKQVDPSGLIGDPGHFRGGKEPRTDPARIEWACVSKSKHVVNKLGRFKQRSMGAKTCTEHPHLRCKYSEICTYFSTMPIVRSYTEARRRLAPLWDRLEESGEVAILQRRGHKDLAVLDADEFAALQETAHLLRSPNTALRLLVALNRALRKTSEAEPVDQMRSELNLDDGSEEDM